MFVDVFEMAPKITTLRELLETQIAHEGLLTCMLPEVVS